MSSSESNKPEVTPNIPRRTFLKRGASVAVTLTIVDLLPVDARAAGDIECNPGDPNTYGQTDASCSPGPYGPLGKPDLVYNKDEHCGPHASGVKQDPDGGCGGLTGEEKNARPVHDEDNSCGLLPKAVDSKDESCDLFVKKKDGTYGKDTDNSPN